MHVEFSPQGPAGDIEVCAVLQFGTKKQGEGNWSDSSFTRDLDRGKQRQIGIRGAVSLYLHLSESDDNPVRNGWFRVFYYYYYFPGNNSWI